MNTETKLITIGNFTVLVSPLSEVDRKINIAASQQALTRAPISTGASGILWAATLDKDGPTGGFFRDKKLISWLNG